MPKVDLPNVSGVKPEGRYITVPELDLFGMTHPGVRLNTEEFSAGNTYFLPTEKANTVEETLRVYEHTSRRVLQPLQDTKALRDVERGSARGLERANVS